MKRRYLTYFTSIYKTVIVQNTIQALVQANLIQPCISSIAKSIYAISLNNSEEITPYRKIYLGNSESRIRDSKVRGISIVTVDQATVLNEVDVLPASVLAQGVLVIVDTKNDELATIPLIDMATTLNANKLLFTQFENVDLSKSYVMFYSAASVNADRSLTFNFYLDHE